MKAETPEPLIRETDPADPFPVDALGPMLEPAALAIREHTLAPMALGAQSVLATASLVVQGFKDLELPTGQIKPVSCFFLSIAATGERKTACDTLALRPVRRFEAERRRANKDAEREWVTCREVYEKLRSDIKNNNKRYPGKEEKEEAMAALGHPPKAPHAPMITCQEPTIEGLFLFLAKARPSIGLFNGEGGQFIGGHGMSEEAKIRTATGLSYLWDGTPIDRLRATDGYLFLDGRRLSMHLMAQPDIAAQLLSDRVLLDQGMLSRILITAPDSTAGIRFYKEPGFISHVHLDKYSDHLYALLIRRLPTQQEDDDILEPSVIKLSEGAKAHWIAYVNEIEAQLGKDGALSSIRGLANKIPEHAGRLAAILTLVENPDNWEIPSYYMEAGIALSAHYMAEAKRLFNAQRVRTRLKMAETTLRWLQHEWPHTLVSLPDLYQRGPNQIRDKDTARIVVRILEEHGWIEELPEGAEIDGARRREVWRIIKS